jgi:hypothetical protein
MGLKEAAGALLNLKKRGLFWEGHGKTWRRGMKKVQVNAKNSGIREPLDAAVLLFAGLDSAAT